MEIHGAKSFGKLAILSTNNMQFEGRGANGTALIRHQHGKTTVLSCHRCLIHTGVEKMNYV
jgi:hypothetical protein